MTLKTRLAAIGRAIPRPTCDHPSHTTFTYHDVHDWSEYDAVPASPKRCPSCNGRLPEIQQCLVLVPHEDDPTYWHARPDGTPADEPPRDVKVYAGIDVGKV